MCEADSMTPSNWPLLD